jgi:transcriptional regulator with XRE-family HTH domain
MYRPPYAAMSEPRKHHRSPKESVKRKLGAALAKARRRRRWPQKELARRLGMSRDRLGKWERGVHTPSLEDVALLSEVLGIPFWELGLGDAPAEALSSRELLELARSFGVMSRLLQPWLGKLRRETARNER